MKILGLDFSTRQRTAAILEVDDEGNSLRQEQAVQMEPKTTRAMELIERVLNATGVKRNEIDVIAMSIGPGSLTGIRISISIAQGWKVANPVRLVGIPSTETLAWKAQEQGIRGPLQVLIDLQCRQYCRVQYQLGESTADAVSDVELMDESEFSQVVAKSTITIGPDLKVEKNNAQSLFPDALTVCRLAAKQPRDHDSLPSPILLRQTKFVKAPSPRIID